MQVLLTKAQVAAAYSSKKSYQELAGEFNLPFDTPEDQTASVKKIKGLFQYAGFETKKRPVFKKEENLWFTIVSDDNTFVENEQDEQDVAVLN